jgi:hypothetical protein
MLVGADILPPLRSPPLFLQDKIHRDQGFDFDRLTIQQSRLVTPLADGVRGGFDEQRISADDFEALDCAVCADDRVENDCSGGSRQFCDGRISWLDAIGEHCLHNIATAGDWAIGLMRS